MIKIDFYWALAIYMLVLLGLVIAQGIFYTFASRQPKGKSKEPTLEQCPYCTYLYFSQAQNPLLQCPRCHSYMNSSQGLNKAKADLNNKG